MRDMKASFTLATPSLTELDLSFMPEISGETQVDDGDGAVVGNGDEGEVVGGVRVAEELEAAAELGVTELAVIDHTLIDIPARDSLLFSRRSVDRRNNVEPRCGEVVYDRVHLSFDLLGAEHMLGVLDNELLKVFHEYRDYALRIDAGG
uniref:Uncharacterized protein n=1 Tax=Ficus carica TaxID=3494 RepID=A0AA88E987_FICCA|nr:hypothetical protein TIFTF001_039487 [Ficus carica]GMN70458.1 hypothetical protein TIFTF001_039503 [Ficus carica]